MGSNRGEEKIKPQNNMQHTVTWMSSVRLTVTAQLVFGYINILYTVYDVCVHRLQDAAHPHLDEQREADGRQEHGAHDHRQLAHQRDALPEVAAL